MILHIVTAFMCAVTAGVAARRAVQTRRVQRLATGALCLFSANLAFAQASLVNAPVTVRTWTSAVAGLVGLVYVFRLWQWGQPEYRRFGQDSSDSHDTLDP